MAEFGFVTNPDSGPIIQVVTGHIQIMDGHGLRIITGVGHHSIMVAGLLTCPMVGSGFREMNGRLLGLVGEPAEAAMDGLH